MSSSIEALQQRLEQVEEHNYELAHDLEAERHHRRAAERDRDALAAHVERVIREWNAGDLFSDEWINRMGDIVEDAPDTSLARRDAVKGVGLLTLLIDKAKGRGDNHWTLKELKMVRDELRRQAEQAEGGGDE